MVMERRLVAAVALFAATLAWRLLTFTGWTNDHYAHLALAQQMLLGDVPVRDFVDPGWPLMYLLSAAGWWLAGNAIWVEWAISSVALGLGTVFTVLAAQRLSGSLAIAVLAALYQMLISPRSYAYPKILVYAAFAYVIASTSVRSRRHCLLLGIVIGVAFLLRHDHGVWTGVAALAYVVLSGRGERARAVAGRAAAVTGAATVVVLPWLLFVAFNGGVIAYFQTALEFARAEANVSVLRSLPWFSVPPGGSVFAVLRSSANADAWLFWLFWTLPVAAAAVVVRRASRGDETWPGEAAAVGALAVLAAGVNAGFLRNLLSTRFADAIVPAVLLGAWLLGVAWIAPWRNRAVQGLARLATVLVCGVSLLAIGSLPEVRDRIEAVNIESGPAGMYDRGVQVMRMLRLSNRQAELSPSRPVAALMPFFTYLERCTVPTERIIVTGEFPDIVVIAGRRFASDGVVFGAWYSSAANQHRTLDRLRAHPAQFVVAADDPERFRKWFPAVARYIDKEYDAFAELESSGVRVPILVDRRRTPTHVDAETGWPCYR